MTSSDWLALSDEELFQSRTFIGDWLEERRNAKGIKIRNSKIVEDPDLGWLVFDDLPAYGQFPYEYQAKRFLVYRIRQILIG